MPFPHLNYFITGIYLSAKAEVLLPPYQLSRVSRRLKIARFIIFFTALFLALYPTLTALFRWIDGVSGDAHFVCAVMLWSLALTVVYFGFFRGAVLTTLFTALGYLLLLFVRLMLSVFAEYYALVWFFLIDITLLLAMLGCYVVRRYRQRHFILLTDLARGEEKWGLNLLPMNLAERLRFPDRYTVFYQIRVALQEEDPYFFRMTVASDLYHLLRRKHAHFIGCSFSPAEKSFSYYLYGDGKSGFLCALRRFMGARCKSFSITEEKDIELLHCAALLPSVQEMFYAYTHLLFSVSSPERIAGTRPLPVSFYFAMQDAKAAAEFVSLCDKEGFHLSDVSREDAQKEEPAATEAPAPAIPSAENTPPLFEKESDGEEAFFGNRLPEYSCYITLIKDIPVNESKLNETTDLLLRLLSDKGQMITWDISFLDMEGFFLKTEESMQE